MHTYTARRFIDECLLQWWLRSDTFLPLAADEHRLRPFQFSLTSLASYRSQFFSKYLVILFTPRSQLVASPIPWGTTMNLGWSLPHKSSPRLGAWEADSLPGSEEFARLLPKPRPALDDEAPPWKPPVNDQLSFGIAASGEHGSLTRLSKLKTHLASLNAISPVLLPVITISTDG